MIERSLSRLMLVTDQRRVPNGEWIARIVDAVAGGVDCIQLREPALDDPTLARWIERLRARLPSRTTLVVNGRVELARRLQLGLHLAARQPVLSSARRRRVDPLGRSVHDLEEASRATTDQVDYAVVGTIFPTPCKPGHPGDGLPQINRLRAAIPYIPLFAIGGIDASRVDDVLAAGAHGVAVTGAILAAADPAKAAGMIAAAIRAATGQGRNDASRTRDRAGSTQAT